LADFTLELGGATLHVTLVIVPWHKEREVQSPSVQKVLPFFEGLARWSDTTVVGPFLRRKESLRTMYPDCNLEDLRIDPLRKRDYPYFTSGMMNDDDHRWKSKYDTFLNFQYGINNNVLKHC
jgi:hypothetical protein